MIICYFGNWPSWFGYFLESCRYNPEIDWLIFSDNNLPHNTENNIKFFHFRKEDFNRLATRKLGFPIVIQDPYKLCDFKPTYGKIFEDYIKDYSFWGYCDIDVIFGKISGFFSHKLFERFDIISTYQGFLSGPFCLFRNKKEINNLFQKHPNYISVFQNPEHVGFDENIIKKINTGYSIKKIVTFIWFCFASIFNLRFNYFSLEEFRYQFQWYYKRIAVKRQDMVDMTDLVHNETKNGKIKVLFKELLVSDQLYKRIHKQNWQLLWKNGKLKDLTSKKKLFGFHFIKSKNKESFEIDKINEPVVEFSISKKGIKIE